MGLSASAELLVVRGRNMINMKPLNNSLGQLAKAIWRQSVCDMWRWHWCL